jgi:hypothetical protein
VKTPKPKHTFIKLTLINALIFAKFPTVGFFLWNFRLKNRPNFLLSLESVFILYITDVELIKSSILIYTIGFKNVASSKFG